MTKAEQLYKNKEPKILRDRKYLDWLKSQPLKCFSCGQQNGIELHHVKKSSSQYKNDHQVIPLCGIKCHRLGDLSPHGNAKAWRETYSYEMQLDYAEKIYQEYKCTFTR